MKLYFELVYIFQLAVGSVDGVGREAEIKSPMLMPAVRTKTPINENNGQLVSEVWITGVVESAPFILVDKIESSQDFFK